MVQRNEGKLAKETYWRKQLVAQTASGLSIAQWCRQNHLSASLFYFWKRTIAGRDGSLGQPAAKLAAASMTEATFARVRLSPPATAPTPTSPMADGLIQILLSDGLCVRVAPGFDAPTLARVLDVLEARSC